MENTKKDLMDLINNAKDEVESIKESITKDKKTIEEINNMSKKLNEIKSALTPKKKDLDDKISKLKTIIKNIEKIKSQEILNNQDNMFMVIEKNLLDGMYLEARENNGCVKDILYDGAGVGSIEVLGNYDTDIKIKVKVYENYDEFIVQHPYKMYSIISFINTKFNYKQGKRKKLST